MDLIVGGRIKERRSQKNKSKNNNDNNKKKGKKKVKIKMGKWDENVSWMLFRPIKLGFHLELEASVLGRAQVPVGSVELRLRDWVERGTWRRIIVIIILIRRLIQRASQANYLPIKPDDEYHQKNYSSIHSFSIPSSSSFRVWLSGIITKKKGKVLG